MADIKKGERFRPLAGISANDHYIRLELELLPGDNSHFGFSDKDFSLLKDKAHVEAPSPILTDLYDQLIKSPEMDLLTFLRTSLAYMGFVY